MAHVVLDFETASACDLKKAGAWRYAEDPTTEVICLAWAAEGQAPRLWLPGDGFPDFPADALFVAHNAAFEKAIWRNIMVSSYNWPDVPNSQWHDTMAVCAMRAMPLALGMVAQVLKLDQQKDKDGTRVTNSLSRFDREGNYDRSDDKVARVAEYCLQDVRTEAALHSRIGILTKGERSVWLLDQRINERGVRIDVDFVAKAQDIVDRASAPLIKEFKQITGLNPGQRDKYLEWLKDHGVALPDLRKETLNDLMGDPDATDYVPGFPDFVDDTVARSLDIRRLIGSASVKKLAAMEHCTCADGRARGAVQYHAGATGRWAGRLFQPQNFPRKSFALLPDEVVSVIMSGDPDYVQAVLGEPIQAVVASLRHAIIPEDDRELIAGDFAGIEARILLAMAGQWDKVELMATGADVYSDMAAQIYGHSINKKDHPVERDIGKHSVLGLGYQMGWKKFQSAYARNQTDDFCRSVVVAYRQRWAPKVQKFWWALENAALNTARTYEPTEGPCGILFEREDMWLTERLPSGRKLWYFSPQVVKKRMPWDEDDVRLAWTFQELNQGRWATTSAYGGLLTGRTIQAIARDIMVHAMFECENQALPIVLTVHDEIVTEPLRSDPGTLKQIMEDIPAWARELKLPIAAETWSGRHYRK